MPRLVQLSASRLGVENYDDTNFDQYEALIFFSWILSQRLPRRFNFKLRGDSCSPVLRHLPSVPPANAIFFHSMWLHQDNWMHRMQARPQALHQRAGTPSGAIEKISALLTESPHLASYVRDLTIDLPDSAAEDMALQRVLKAVPNLERFVISGLSMRWDALSPGLAAIILDVLAQPVLDHLHLLSMRDVPAHAILSALSTMRVLSIHHTSFNEAEPPAISRPPTTPRLEHLIFATGLPSTYEFILSPYAPRLTNVKKLFLLDDMVCRLHAERLLSSIGGTLECLELDYGILSRSSMLNLPHLPNLRSLTLLIFCGFRKRLPEELAGALAALPPTPLTLQFTMQVFQEEEKWVEDGPLLGLEGWKGVSIHCELFFIAAERSQPASRDTAFDGFCSAVRAGFPGFSIEFSRRGEKKPCVVRQLPW
ncbi:hypothetical protein C8R44DRAFT_846451 [Mycena epipterygia]|nr:hypothetical protein C8R44DRAFT_846451 [Mycena epipterygia]